jgi:leader peptidase (prepilin peptidase)/N-methyltransferase
MAFGDVRLAGAIGLFAGWYSPRRALVAFIVATGLAALVSLALLATRRASLRTALPFGVFLAAGTVIAVLA